MNLTYSIAKLVFIEEDNPMSSFEDDIIASLYALVLLVDAPDFDARAVITGDTDLDRSGVLGVAMTMGMCQR